MRPYFFANQYDGITGSFWVEKLLCSCWASELQAPDQISGLILNTSSSANNASLSLARQNKYGRVFDFRRNVCVVEFLWNPNWLIEVAMPYAIPHQPGPAPPVLFGRPSDKTQGLDFGKENNKRSFLKISIFGSSPISVFRGLNPMMDFIMLFFYQPAIPEAQTYSRCLALNPSYADGTVGP